MTCIQNVTHHVIHNDPEGIHCENRVVIKQLHNREVMAIFNEERFPYHSDTCQTVLDPSW